MAFKKGMPRPIGAGRRKGSLNKRTVLRVEEFLTGANINPVAKAVELIPLLEPKEQFDAWMELHSYCERKPKETPDKAPTEGEVLTMEDVLELTDVTPQESDVK